MRPEEEHIKMNLCYTTRVFRRRPEDAGGHSPLVILPTEKNMRGGTMLAVEGDRWIATLAGYLGDAAPMDMDRWVKPPSINTPPASAAILKNSAAFRKAIWSAGMPCAVSTRFMGKV